MQIFVHRTSLMQRTTRHICNGYHHYISGVVPAAKAVDFAGRFSIRFRSTIGETQRWKDRKDGRAATYFLIHPRYTEPAFDWWLVMTDGAHPARDSEKHWRDLLLKRQHLVLFEQYEAVRTFSSLAPAEIELARGRWSKTDKNNPPWTWRMTDRVMENYRTRIRDAVRRRRDSDAQLKGVFVGLARAPGFREVRDQVFELHTFARDEWRRIKAAGQEVPILPPVGPWVRFQRAPMVALEIVAGRLSEGLPPYPPELVLSRPAPPDRADADVGEGA